MKAQKTPNSQSSPEQKSNSGEIKYHNRLATNHHGTGTKTDTQNNGME
jgi:hypothetical protein